MRSTRDQFLQLLIPENMILLHIGSSVYAADLLIQQYDYYGQYQNGFLNSIFGQKGCTVTTDGYNYIALNDDVYVYTGVTSLGGDESNIGFILVNQRTKAANYYPCAGAS